MVVHRTLTKYRRVHEATNGAEEDNDDVELWRLTRSNGIVEQGSIQPTIAPGNDTSSMMPPEDHLDELSTSVEQSVQDPRQKKFLSGWRVGALCSLIGATTVCVFNLAITIYIWTGPYEKLRNSVGTLFKGDCGRVRTLNVWIHLVVNILSTLLLCASNYCMQVVSAPTRAELVRAHSRRVWLHIGVPSLRNLRYISRARALVWFALFLSSVPLHLLFNSVIFTNMQANDYYVFSVTQAWLDGPGYNDSTTTRMNLTTVEIASPGWLEHALKDSIAPHLRLSTADCFDTYDDHYVSRAGTVYIVQDGIIATVGSKETPDENTPTDWRCRDKEQPCEVSKDKSDWRLDDAPIEYCIVEEVEERCRLDFSFVIASLVIVSNFTKAICMALIIFKYRRHSPLVTLGDTVAHFLDFPDPETKGRCLFSRRLMDAQWTWEFSNGANKDELGVDPERYIPKHWRWQTAPSAYRWSSTYIMYAVTLIFGMVFMARSLASMPRDQARRWDFGAIDGKNVLRMNTSLMGAILLANLPQAILSYLYLTFNALYTNMFVAREWSTYGGERKPLRVTSPVGQQRDTYWLNVPFRWAIPMTILSGLFHWLASQSIFLVQITITATQDRQVTRLMSTCGYSAVAIILCIVVGTIVAIGGLVIGRFKYVSAMPMASSCSAAISAACHPLPEDAHASTLPVQWGVVARGDRYTEGDKAVGHCAFSSLPVQQPIQGRLYA